MRRSSLFFAGLLIVAVATQGFCGSAPEGTDWHQWRGPNRDGTTPDADWNPEALNDLKILWQAKVGIGYSLPVVSGKHLYIAGTTKRVQEIRCLKADTGEEVWKHVTEFDKVGYAVQGTGLIDGDRFYVVGADGDLLCLDRKDGQVVWQKHLERDLGAYRPANGWAISPTAVGDLLIVNAGTFGMAVDKHTGDLVWGEPGGCAYASPVPFEMGDKRYVAILGAIMLHIVDLERGEPVWTYFMSTDFGNNAADPLVVDGDVFTYNRGRGALLRLSGDGVEELWSTPDASSYLSSWVFVNGYIYGNNGNQEFHRGVFCCIDPKTGRHLWSVDQGAGCLIAAGDKLILLAEKGGIKVAAADPSGYREFSAAELPRGRGVFWVPPVLVGNRLYVKSAGADLYCIDMR